MTFDANMRCFYKQILDAQHTMMVFLCQKWASLLVVAKGAPQAWELYMCFVQALSSAPWIRGAAVEVELFMAA